DGESGEDTEPPSDLDALTEYVQAPVSSTTLVLVSTDLDKTRKLGKTLLKHAVIVECWGLKNEKNPRFVDFRATARRAEEMVRPAGAASGQPSAAAGRGRDL